MMRRHGFVLERSFAPVHMASAARDGEMVMMRQVNEIGFTLCRLKNGKLAHGPIAEGTPVSVDIPVECPTGAKLQGLFHTHPGGVPVPSPKDIESAKRVGAEYLCIDADGDLHCYRFRKK